MLQVLAPTFKAARFCSRADKYESLPILKAASLNLGVRPQNNERLGRSGFCMSDACLQHGGAVQLQLVIAQGGDFSARTPLVSNEVIHWLAFR
jgi:hypothetical protein